MDEGTRIAFLWFRYDSPNIYVHHGIKSSWSFCVQPSRGLLMGSMSVRKQRIRKVDGSCWGVSDEMERERERRQSPRKWSRCLRYICTGLHQVGWNVRKALDIDRDTVGRSVEFEWQLIKGYYLANTSLSCQYGPLALFDSSMHSGANAPVSRNTIAYTV